MTRYYYRRPNGNDLKSSNCVSPDKETLKRPATSHSNEPATKLRPTGQQSRHLIDIFSGKRFYAHTSQSESGSTSSCADNSADRLTDEIARLKRLIIAYDGDWSDLLDSSVTHVICFPCLGIRNCPVQLNPEQPYELITPAWIDTSIRKMECQAEVDYRP